MNTERHEYLIRLIIFYMVFAFTLSQYKTNKNVIYPYMYN